jgi:multidrug efflux pump subunit AcrB
VPVSIVGTIRGDVRVRLLDQCAQSVRAGARIGIVVDDAIVVVENVERNIEEARRRGEATYKAMQEVSGPIVAIALVLIAVFVPLAFISGLDRPVLSPVRADHPISTVISAITRSRSPPRSPRCCSRAMRARRTPSRG